MNEEGGLLSDSAIPLKEWVIPRVEKAMPCDFSGEPYLGLDDIEAHTTRLIGSKSAGDMKSSAKRFYRGDVLYSRLRPYLNKVWLTDRTGLCSAEFIVLPSNGFIDGAFLKYRLNAMDFVSFANSLNAGDRPRVDFEQISSFCLPPFSLALQRRIVAKIEELFSELDAGEESLRVARRQLGVYRQSLLKQAFEGKLNEGWRALKVGEIGRIETGTTPPTANPKNYDGDLPFFKPTDLEQGRFVRKAREHLSETGQEHARMLPKGSVLVTCIGATIGKAGLSQLPCATNQQINSISPNDQVLPEFAYYQVISPRFQEQIKTNASSTTLPILNKSKFCALPFVVCSLPEQQEIIRLLDEQFEVIERNEREIDAALRRSEALRQAILKKAFTGQPVPQDPADEPASVLLELFREQKMNSGRAHPPTKKRSKVKRI